MRKMIVLITAAVFLSAVAGLALFSSTGSPKPIVLTAPVFGDKEAPVELVLFEDYKCYACRIFSTNILPQIISEYLATNRIRLKIVPLGFLHGSKVLANAALEVCRLAPEQFIPYSKRIFARFESTDVDESTGDILLALAKENGNIDLKKLKTCIEQQCHYFELDRYLGKAKSLMRQNVHIPALYVNGVRVSTSDYEAIKQEIERAEK